MPTKKNTTDGNVTSWQGHKSSYFEAVLGQQDSAYTFPCLIQVGHVLQHHHIKYPYSDLMASSCVNKEVETFNNKLYNIMENKVNVKILDHQATREDFTRHGLHLNGTGKNKVVKLMSQNICQLLKVKLKHPIIEERKSTLNDQSFVDSVPQDINEDQVVIDSDRREEVQSDSTNHGMQEDHVAIDSDRRNEDQTESINQRIYEEQVTSDSDRRKKLAIKETKSRWIQLTKE